MSLRDQLRIAIFFCSAVRQQSCPFDAHRVANLRAAESAMVEPAAADLESVWFDLYLGFQPPRR